MSTVALNPTKPLSGRLASVVKLHFANPWTSIIMPTMVLGIIFAMSLAVWGIIFLATPQSTHVDIAEGIQWSGGSLYIFIYMMVVAVQAVNVTFGFALGYGVTRRDYYLGTALQFLILSVFYSVLLTIMSVLERLTGGWGLGGQMFTAGYFGDGPWYEHMAIFFLLFTFFFFVGAALAAVFVRWRATGMIVFFASLGVLLVGALFLVTATESWPAVGNFFVTAGLFGSYAWSLVLTAIAAIAGYLILRKATPRS